MISNDAYIGMLLILYPNLNPNLHLGQTSAYISVYIGLHRVPLRPIATQYTDSLIYHL